MSVKVAAVLLLAVPGAAILLFLAPGGSMPALAVMQEAAANATSASYMVTVTVDDKPGDKVKVMLLGSQLCRAVQADGTITIFDVTQRTMVRLLPAEKKAIVIQGLAGQNDFDILKLLTNLSGHPARVQRPVPDRVFDGREAEGFVVELDHFVYSVWSDKATHLPLRLESERKLIIREEAGEREQAIKEVWSDFAFNGKLDESLFSLIPPQDYEVEKQTVSNGPDAVLAEQKRAIAEVEKAKKALAEIQKAGKQAGGTK